MRETSKPLAVLRLVDTISVDSGPYNQFSLSLSLSETGKYNITICTLLKAKIPPAKELALFEGDGSVLGCFRALKTALNEKAYDVIHIHSPYFGVLFIITSFLMRKASLYRATVYTVHNSYPNFKLKHRLLMIPIFALFRRIVCVSESSFESLPNFYKWLAGDRLCVVQNGVDIERVDRVIGSAGRHPRADSFTIAAVGRLIEVKNPMTALEAFYQSADETSRLVFIGEGRLHKSVTLEINRLNLENRVNITGLIPREKVFEHLVNTDLFVSTSYGEGLPIAVLEAMACRCPVLLSDIPPHREIAAGVDFIPLVHPDDSAGFAREIKRIRQISPSERAEIGEKCRQLVEKHFSLAAMHEKYEQIYLQVMKHSN